MKFVFLPLFLSANLWAQSAIISLVMPPPGAEGFQSLQFGGAFPDGVASMYYNPALLSNLARSTGSQIHFTKSRQELLPILGLQNLDQEFSAGALIFPDPKRGFDLGIGLSKILTRFGNNSNVSADESVHSLGIGLRLGLPVSLGTTAKFYHSRLSSGESGRTYGWAFDFGALLHPRILPLAQHGIQSLVLLPSAGFAWQNLGPDAFYSDPIFSDPIPAYRRYSSGLKTKFIDAVELSAGLDYEQDAHRRVNPGTAPVILTGYSFYILGYRFSQCWLDDEDGDRDEMHFSNAIELGLLRMLRFLKRVETRDFQSSSENISPTFPFPTTHIFGIPFRANPRLVIGSREIRSRDGGIRDGQNAFYWGVSL